MAARDPFGIYEWQRLNDVVTTSGRLRADDLEELANLGIKHVIDLTPSSHEMTLKDEGARLSRLGIQHTLIEVPFNSPTEDHYQQFVKAYEASPLPVHVHCIYNYRVSAFFYRYHLEQGVPVAEAKELMMVHWSPDASDHPAARPWKVFIDDTTRNYRQRRTGT